MRPRQTHIGGHQVAGAEADHIARDQLAHRTSRSTGGSSGSARRTTVVVPQEGPRLAAFSPSAPVVITAFAPPQSGRPAGEPRGSGRYGE